MSTITYGSVCSGIEAASVAWHSMGWQAAWLAEIEPFPSAVLAHHYPDVPNLGDMTKIAAMVRAGTVAAPDVLVGGTPCQAFSIAGLRNSLGDARGQLSLSFVDLANAIDAARVIRGESAATVLWENVPGVLSTKDNAFGCFLGALSGEDEPVVPPGKKWTNAGCVFGPQRTVAWRVLDAQYFGVAQRRRRVFVVASARKGFDPAAVLFEFDGLRRDFAPSRETGQDVAGTISARTQGGGGLGTDFECEGGLQPVRGLGVAGTLTAGGKAPGSATQQDAENGMLVPCAIQAGALRTNPNSGPDGVGIQPHIAYTLEARAEVQAVAFSYKDHGADATVELAPAMRAMWHSSSHANAGGQLAVCIQNATRGKSQNGLGVSAPGAPMFTLDQGSQHAVCVTGDIPHTLKAEGFDASEDGTGRGQPITLAFTTEQTPKFNKDCALTLTKQSPTGGGQIQSVMQGMAVRRLTPKECARLQAFPDDYLSQVIVRNKPAADGPMYKALGNSMCVENMAWLGRRINNAFRSAA